MVLLPRMCIATQPVWALPRSLATTGGIISLFSLPAGTKMFQFPAFASLLTAVIAALQAAGLSHSEIRGSRDICSYPRLIAAYHVLHRLREPRHPPDALAFFRRLPQHKKTPRLAHTISCNFEILFSVSKNKVFYLQSCVSICQRSL